MKIFKKYCSGEVIDTWKAHRSTAVEPQSPRVLARSFKRAGLCSLPPPPLYITPTHLGSFMQRKCTQPLIYHTHDISYFLTIFVHMFQAEKMQWKFLLASIIQNDVKSDFWVETDTRRRHRARLLSRRIRNSSKYQISAPSPIHSRPNGGNPGISYSDTAAQNIKPIIDDGVM